MKMPNNSKVLFSKEFSCNALLKLRKFSTQQRLCNKQTINKPKNLQIKVQTKWFGWKLKLLKTIVAADEAKLILFEWWDNLKISSDNFPVKSSTLLSRNFCQNRCERELADCDVRTWNQFFVNSKLLYCQYYYYYQNVFDFSVPIFFRSSQHY